MSAYGFSLWLVPKNYSKLQKMYNISHIPHITICTNLTEKIDTICLSKETFIVNKFSSLLKFPKFYKTDWYNSSGFYCDVEKIKTEHQPHLTLQYSHKNIENYKPPDSLECQLHMADTRSFDCNDWYIIG